jgi:hypothetical protein
MSRLIHFDLPFALTPKMLLHTEAKIQLVRPKWCNAEGVRQCQPRVCFETLGSNCLREIIRNPERVAVLY